MPSLVRPVAVPLVVLLASFLLATASLSGALATRVIEASDSAGINNSTGNTAASGGRSLGAGNLLADFLSPDRLMGQAQNVTKQLLPASPLDPNKMVESLKSGLKSFMKNLAGPFGKLVPGLDGGEKGEKSGKKGAYEGQEKDSRRKEELKNPLEKMLSGLKSPELDRLTKGMAPLLDGPKKVMDNFSQILYPGGGSGNSRNAPAGPFGAFFENFKGLRKGGDDKKGNDSASKSTGAGDEKSAKKSTDGIVQQANAAVKSLAGSSGAAASSSEMLKSASGALASVESVKRLVDGAEGKKEASSGSQAGALKSLAGAGTAIGGGLTNMVSGLASQ